MAVLWWLWLWVCHSHTVLCGCSDWSSDAAQDKYVICGLRDAGDDDDISTR